MTLTLNQRKTLRTRTRTIVMRRVRVVRVWMVGRLRGGVLIRGSPYELE